MLARLATTIALAALLALGFVPARAAAEPIPVGATTLELSRSLYERLRANDVHLRALKPGTARRRALSFPASSGQIEATYGSGYLFYEGGIKLQVRKRKVVVTRLILNTTERWLRAKIGGREMTIATVEDTSAGWDGFDIAVALNLRLTQRAANLLNRRLDLDGVFQAGRRLAAADTIVRPETVGVRGGTIELVFDPGFLAKLESLGVAISTAESAALAGSTLVLPIFQGAISPDLLRGNLFGESGFALLQEGPLPEQVQQARFIAIILTLESDRLDAAINLPTGLFGGGQLANVDVNSGASHVDPATGSIAARGAIAMLDAGIAAALNDTFATPLGKAGVFVAGEPLAAVSFTVQTR
ncbi:MAG: hypothetical protein WA687_01375 [Solirubrobacterales bacterium]